MVEKQKLKEQEINTAQIIKALQGGTIPALYFNMGGGIAGGREYQRYIVGDPNRRIGSTMNRATLVEVDRKKGEYALIFYPKFDLGELAKRFRRLDPKNRDITSETISLIYRFTLSKPANGKLEYGGVDYIAPGNVGRYIGEITFSYDRKDLVKFAEIPGITKNPEKEFDKNFRVMTTHLPEDPFGKDLKVAIPKNMYK